jgi:hypothetical protein
MILELLATLLSASVAFAEYAPNVSSDLDLRPRASCENTATSRNCRGDYSIDTNYYDVFPDTGVVRGMLVITCIEHG